MEQTQTQQGNQQQAQAQQQSQLLRYALRGNGLFSASSGLILVAAGPALSSFTGITPALALQIVGAVLLLYGAGLLWISTRAEIDRRVAWTAIILDVAWVAGSIMILLAGWLPLTVAGKWTVAVLADVVAVFAIVQYVGLRRLPPG